jgi:hypothetical protein
MAQGGALQSIERMGDLAIGALDLSITDFARQA